MIDEMIEKVKPCLPLKITNINWHRVFHLSGPSWSFDGVCAWRISSEKKVDFGCYDSHSEELAASLKLLDIIDIDFQTRLLKVDPVFILSNGQRIEIFSTLMNKSWTFKVADLPMFVGMSST